MEHDQRATHRGTRHRGPGPGCWVVCCTLAPLLLWSAGAQADRIDRLNQILRTDPSYKVRLQVAITLGKLRDKRAVPALVTALKDGNATVQGVAAAALGQIGDRSARSALKRLARKGRSPFAKSQARKALAQLESAALPGRGARFFVTVGKMGNKTAQGGQQLSQALGQSLLQQFSRVEGVATSLSGPVPPTKVLRKRGVKAFVLDGSIVSLSHQRRGHEVEISCNIRVSLATYPQNSMRAFYTGGATMAVSASSFQPSAAMQLYKELLGGAAQGARQHIVRSYLAHQ